MNKNLVLGITGSIAAYKAPEIIRRFQEKDYIVSSIMTKEAESFISALTISSLLKAGKFYQSNFLEDYSGDIPHIKLAQEADVFLIAPATANIISKIAYGIADDLLTCIALATRAKIVLAPSMNVNMYMNNIIQDNCKRLVDYGIKIVEPKEGVLACGDTGKGRLADIDEIIDVVENL